MPYLCTVLSDNRNVAQLVAHYVRDVGVGRSSRLIPTERQKLQNCSFCLFFFCFVRFFITENSSLNSIFPTETYRYTDGLTPFSGQRDIPYEKDMGLNEKTPISERKDTHI